MRARGRRPRRPRAAAWAPDPTPASTSPAPSWPPSSCSRTACATPPRQTRAAFVV